MARSWKSCIMPPSAAALGKPWWKGDALKVSERKAIEFDPVVSRTHRDQHSTTSCRLPCRNQHYVSVGCKIATIVEQQADIYISLSGKSAPKDWDLAAQVNTHRSRWTVHPLRWHPLKYNQGDVNQWGGLLASNGHCHAALCTEAERILAESKEKLRAKLREIPIWSLAELTYWSLSRGISN